MKLSKTKTNTIRPNKLLESVTEAHS